LARSLFKKHKLINELEMILAVVSRKTWVEKVAEQIAYS
jgi:hypothetical protein